MPKPFQGEQEETVERKLFTDSELKTLLSSAVHAGATDAQCQRLVRWATRTVVDSVMLSEILKGKVLVKVTHDGSPVFAGERKERP